MDKITKIAHAVTLVSALTACQAEEIEIELNATDILDAFTTSNEFRTEFEATVGQKYTKIDDEKRETIDRVLKILQSAMPDADIESDIKSDEYEIEIEGEVIVSTSAPSESTPYFVKLSEGPLKGSVLVTLEASASFPAFSDRLKEINFLLAPDEFQGVEFKISGSNERILTFGSYVDGTPITISVHNLSSGTIKLEMSDGIWKKAPAGFVILPN